MAQGTYQSVVLAQRPNENIIPGETFSIKTNPSATESDLKDGQVLIEALYLSLDPAMRGWLNGSSSPTLFDSTHALLAFTSSRLFQPHLSSTHCKYNE